MAKRNTDKETTLNNKKDNKVSSNFLSSEFEKPVVKSIAELSGGSRFFNRESSWLDFNTRVLEEAANLKIPLLERLRFLSISGTNLDEFYSVRVAGWRQLAKTDPATLSEDGLTPFEQLRVVDDKARKIIARQDGVWNSLVSELKEQNIQILIADDLKKTDEEFLENYFFSDVFPVITPLAIDPAHPFPFIPNGGLSLGLELKRQTDGIILRVLLPIPSQIKRFILLPSEFGEYRYLSLDQLLLMKIKNLFPGYAVLSSCTFAVLRDSDLEVEEEADDLVREFEVALKRRRTGEVVRLKLSESPPKELRSLIVGSLDVLESEIIEVKDLVGFLSLKELLKIPRKDLIWNVFLPRIPERVLDHNGDMFEAIKQKDMLLHHPYETFDMVVKFLSQAAEDKNVIAIKQTLYRTSNQSSIIDALCTAAENGKSVTAFIELRARFDEAANIRQARKLERSGAHVVYGFMNYKTHAKISVVVRREKEKLMTYTHFGTGNYHPITARFYTDLSLFTCDVSLGQDATKVFNYIGGYAQPESLTSMAISPINLKENLINMIGLETKNALGGHPAAIWAKLNSISDSEVIDALYEASSAGVMISLVVRGICGIKPGIKGLSENIRVKSIVGRFLEHSRIICFGNGNLIPSKDSKVYISSADWMSRNLNWRVETLVEICNPTVKEQVVSQIMAANMADTASSWVLSSDGKYKRDTELHGSLLFSCHRFFMENPSLSGRGSAGASDVPELAHSID